MTRPPATAGSAGLPTANAPQMTVSMPSNIAPIVLVPPGTTAGNSHEELAVRLARSRGRWQQDERLSQGRLGEDSRGQAKEQRTCTKAQLADAPPPANPLSSHVLLHGCPIGCASDGARSNVPQEHHKRARKNGCASPRRLPQRGCLAAPRRKSQPSTMGRALAARADSRAAEVAFMALKNTGLLPVSHLHHYYSRSTTTLPAH